MRRFAAITAWHGSLALLIMALWGGLVGAAIDTHYVWTNSPSPSAGPGATSYTNWDTAAHDIQSAINSAESGDTVLVTNGVYTNSLNGTMNTNQVQIIRKPLKLLSVNGPEVTIIDGNYPFVTNRCIYASTSGVEIIGFTVRNGIVTNGLTHGYGAGIYMPKGGIVRNCIVSGNQVTASGGTSYGAAGISLGVPTDITHTGLVDNCWIVNNTNAGNGGGFYTTGSSTIKDSRIVGNVAAIGGGARLYTGGIMLNCQVISNTASYGGGLQVHNALVQNCLIYTNVATSTVNGGGGIYFQNAICSTIRNCTIVHNYSGGQGGGAYTLAGTNVFVNTIIASNRALNNNYGVHYKDNTGSGSYSNCSLQAAHEVSNRTNAFCLIGIDNGFVNAAAGDFRLLPRSLCVNAGTNEEWMSEATDLGGLPRLYPRAGLVDIGAYEYHLGGTLMKVR